MNFSFHNGEDDSLPRFLKGDKEVWSLGRTRTDGICKLTERAISAGSLVYRPRSTGRRQIEIRIAATQDNVARLRAGVLGKPGSLRLNAGTWKMSAEATTHDLFVYQNNRGRPPVGRR